MQIKEFKQDHHIGQTAKTLSSDVSQMQSSKFNIRLEYSYAKIYFRI